MEGENSSVEAILVRIMRDSRIIGAREALLLLPYVRQQYTLPTLEKGPSL